MCFSAGVALTVTTTRTPAGAEAGGQQRRTGIRRLIPLALVLLVGLTFANAVRNPFQTDDVTYIVENDRARVWPGPLGYLRPPVLDGAGRVRAFYRPVTMLSFHASFRLGEGAAGFRLVGLVLHAASVILLWLLARRLLGRLAARGRFPAVAVEAAAAAAAAVFAVHPLVTQTLNEVSKRDTLLAGVFMLGALHAYLVALGRLEDEAGQGRGFLGPLAAGALLQALALGSKEVAVSVPVLLVLCDLLVPGPARFRSRRLAVHGTSVLLSAALVLGFGLWAAAGHLPDRGVDGPAPTTVQYLLGQPGVILRYFGLMLVPHALSAYHEVAAVPGALTLAFLGPLAALAALVVASLAAARRLPEVALAVVGSLAHFVPTSAVRNVIAMDEDRTYVPLMLVALALCAVVARGLSRLGERHPRLATRGAVVVVAVAALGLGAGSVLRNGDWSSRRRLWESAALVYPASRSVLLYYAGALAEEGATEDRLAVLRHAAGLHPGDVRVRVFYAHALARAGQPAAAWRIAREVAAEAPDNPEVLTLVGHLHRAAGDLPAAAESYGRALAADGASATARIYLADAVARLGRAAEARHLLGGLSPHLRLSRGEAALVEDLRGRLQDPPP